MFKITTESGSIYHIDEETLMWRRENPSNKRLKGMETRNSGKMLYMPIIQTGFPLFIEGDDHWVTSTTIVRVEEV